MTSQITIDSLLAGPTKDDVAKSAADAKAGQIAIANRNNIWKTDLDAETIARIEAMMPQRETTMTTIRMTTEQTATYDSGDEPEQREMMSGLLAKAEKRVAETGEAVEIVTADGIVAAFVM